MKQESMMNDPMTLDVLVKARRQDLATHGRRDGRKFFGRRS
ncbi:MAG TPA: hypothetical protein PK593_04370 [Thermomicrobiales bacterium]|nr:hypothetical protein [Thermomicrobiales bacterium]